MGGEWLSLHKDQGGVRGSRDQPRRGAQASQCRWEPPKVLWHLGPQHMAAVQPASQRNFERPCDPAKGRRFYLASLQEECSVLVSENPLRGDGLLHCLALVVGLGPSCTPWRRQR